MPVNHPDLTVANAADWARWLDREADNSNGVMLTLVKKDTSGATSLTWEQARDEALCHGWIDSTGFKRDDGTRSVRFTPRRDRSVWSKHNINHVARLETEGRMRPRGWAEVNKAKADGRWDAAYCQASNEVPPDLSAAIAAVPTAQAQWDILTKQNKFAICFRLAALKVPANRPKRIQFYVDMLARGGTIHPQKRTLVPSEPVAKPTPKTKTKAKAHKPTRSEQTTDEPGRRRSARLRNPGRAG